MKLPATGGMLEIYLNDHLGGATGGAELAARAAKPHSNSPDAEVLDQLAREIREDRESLLQIMHTLQVPVRQYKVIAGWAMEKLGRVKPNGHVLQRSPLADLIELEALQLGVHGKIDVWRSLQAIADQDDRLDKQQLDHLVDRATEQLRTLERLHRSTARRSLSA